MKTILHVALNVGLKNKVLPLTRIRTLERRLKYVQKGTAMLT